MWYNHLGLLLLTYPLGRWTWTGCNRAIIQKFILQGVGFTSHSENQTEKRKRTKKKKKRSAQKKSSNPQRFHRYGLVYHSRFGRTEYSHPNSIVLIQEKKAPPGLSRERDDVREKRVRGEQCNCSDNKRRTRRRRRRTRNWRRKRRKESLIERYLNRI